VQIFFTMASSTKYDDDEYVAKLLAEDAKKSSLRYAQQGLSGLLPRRPTGAAPKPNTRFLKNLVREADSHNAALKKKEEMEARLRQRELNERERHNRVGDGYIDADRRPVKRRRYDDEDDYRQRRRANEDRDHSRQNTTSERSRSPERRHGRNRRARDDAHTKSRLHRISDRDRRRHRSRSSSELPTMDRPNRSRTEVRRKELEDPPKERQRWSQSTASATPEDEKKPRKKNRERQSDASDSDPLETLVGPLDRSKENHTIKEKPPIRSKGRGAYKPSNAAMDAHFSSDYNPGLDLHPESEPEGEKEDWDMALEALRDREMFKQKHAERLREAGFGDAEIKKWEDSGKEKGVDDVKWAGKGQAREWDVGKVVDDSR
jgi:hypothetical protein